jgi:hypothetical protein
MAKKNPIPNLDLQSLHLILQSLPIAPVKLPSKLLCIRTVNSSPVHPEGHSLRAQKGHSW